ncbi:TPA: hypothetical protein ACH3X1_006658 [Trebouxia sp. C0004]
MTNEGSGALQLALPKVKVLRHPTIGPGYSTSSFSPGPSQCEAQPAYNQQSIHYIQATANPLPEAIGGFLGGVQGLLGGVQGGVRGCAGGASSWGKPTFSLSLAAGELTGFWTGGKLFSAKTHRAATSVEPVSITT